MQQYHIGTIDFCFKNTRSYPIKIESSVENGVVTTEIYGIKEEKEYEVVIESTVIEVIPYTIKYIKDNTKRIPILIICVLLPIVIGFTRVYLGVHFFSDVLGGLLLGFVVSVAEYTILKKDATEFVTD